MLLPQPRRETCPALAPRLDPEGLLGCGLGEGPERVSSKTSPPNQPEEEKSEPGLCASRFVTTYLKLSTTDLLVLASMKNAAKCDK